MASHLVRGPVLLAGAGAGLPVVLARVHDLALGALPDQVSADAGHILETVTWRGRGRGGKDVTHARGTARTEPAKRSKERRLRKVT